MLRVVLFISLALNCFAWEEHPNFSGTWHLSPELSDFGKATPPKSLVSRIRHQDPALIVNSTTTDGKGTQQSEYRWWTDGYPCANTIRGIEYATRVVWDGHTLLATSTASNQQGPIEIADHWSISKDGKTLKVGRVLKIAGARVEQTYVYTRK